VNGGSTSVRFMNWKPSATPSSAILAYFVMTRGSGRQGHPGSTDRPLGLKLGDTGVKAAVIAGARMMDAMENQLLAIPGAMPLFTGLAMGVGLWRTLTSSSRPTRI
jgi:hypothetical protein